MQVGEQGAAGEAVDAQPEGRVGAPLGQVGVAVRVGAAQPAEAGTEGGVDRRRERGRRGPVGHRVDEHQAGTGVGRAPGDPRRHPGAVAVPDEDDRAGRDRLDERGHVVGMAFEPAGSGEVCRAGPTPQVGRGQREPPAERHREVSPDEVVGGEVVDGDDRRGRHRGGRPQPTTQDASGHRCVDALRLGERGRAARRSVVPVLAAHLVERDGRGGGDVERPDPAELGDERHRVAGVEGDRGQAAILVADDEADVAGEVGSSWSGTASSASSTPITR